MQVLTQDYPTKAPLAALVAVLPQARHFPGAVPELVYPAAQFAYARSVTSGPALIIQDTTEASFFGTA